MNEEKPEVTVSTDVTITGADGEVTKAEAKLKGPKISKAKLAKIARRLELRKNERHYPPGSSWERRDGSIAKAGPRYGAGA